MRALSGSMDSGLAGSSVMLAYLAEFLLDSGALRLNTSTITLPWNGFTWNPAGPLGKIEPTTESAAGDIPGLKLELSGVPSAYVTVALGEHVQGRVFNLYLALFDASGQIIGTPSLEWSGLLDTMQIADSGATATIAVSAESRLIDYSRPRGRRFNSHDQKRDYPTDEFFSHVEAMVDATIVWPSKEYWRQ